MNEGIIGAAEVGVYHPSESFKRQGEHVAVMDRKTGELIAITGNTLGVPKEALAKSLGEAAVFSIAWEMLNFLKEARDPANPLHDAADHLFGELTTKMDGLVLQSPNCGMEELRDQAMDYIAERIQYEGFKEGCV